MAVLISLALATFQAMLSLRAGVLPPEVTDTDGDGIADGFYRPNDVMDQILWSQPAASLLIGSPAVQLVRWSQRDFPATLPGGVRDSAPLMRPLIITVPPEILVYEAEAAGRWATGHYDDTDPDNLSAH